MSDIDLIIGVKLHLGCLSTYFSYFSLPKKWFTLGRVKENFAKMKCNLEIKYHWRILFLSQQDLNEVQVLKK